MSMALLIIQGLCAAMIVSCISVMLIAALKFMCADPEQRVLIAPAPSGDNIIPFRNTRLKASGSKLSFQAPVRPNSGG